MREDLEYLLLGESKFNKPNKCDNCGGKLTYKGIGEYQCSECKNIMYDDYGSVRNYIENNAGATLKEIAKETGVSVACIKQMLRDEKFQIASSKRDG